MFDIKNGYAPPSFNNYWSYNYQNIGYSLHNRDDFVIPNHARRNENLPKYYFPKLFNKLPNHIKIINHRKTFLTELRGYLISTINH